jgi:hypothetical protein
LIKGIGNPTTAFGSLSSRFVLVSCLSSILHWGRADGKAEWKDVILEEEFKDRLQRDYRSFYKSEKIYKDLQVPWKRGLIFLGVSSYTSSDQLIV